MEASTVAKKRPRSANWDEKEKLAFITIVKTHVAVVDDKNKTLHSNIRKDEAWQEIQNGMEKLGYKRDAYRLREQWLRMKAHAKKTIKTYHMIGNRRNEVAPPTSVDYMIRDVVPEEFDTDEADGKLKITEGPPFIPVQPAGSDGGSSVSSLKRELSEEELIVDIDNDEKMGVQPVSTTNDGETTDTAEASDQDLPEKREETDPYSDGSSRPKKYRSPQTMSRFEMASLELKKMKSKIKISQEAELHRIRMEAALWEKRFWEAKVLRIKGFGFRL